MTSLRCPESIVETFSGGSWWAQYILIDVCCKREEKEGLREEKLLSPLIWYFSVNRQGVFLAVGVSVKEFFPTILWIPENRKTFLSSPRVWFRVEEGWSWRPDFSVWSNSRPSCSFDRGVGSFPRDL